MIIKRKHKNRFAMIPNHIWQDLHLSIEAKGTLAYLLSKPDAWEVRHDQLMRSLRVGRRVLNRIVYELCCAGYLQRDYKQGRDENNRFQTYNYVVTNDPDRAAGAEWKRRFPDVHSAQRRSPMRETCIGNKKESINTEFNNPPKSPQAGAADEPHEASRNRYSAFGQHAFENGMVPVFEGSEPFEAWVRHRGVDGIPPIDVATIDGKRRRVVWLPTLYPPSQLSGARDDDRVLQ